MKYSVHRCNGYFELNVAFSPCKLVSISNYFKLFWFTKIVVNPIVVVYLPWWRYLGSQISVNCSHWLVLCSIIHDLLHFSQITEPKCLVLFSGLFLWSTLYEHTLRSVLDHLKTRYSHVPFHSKNVQLY